jgi:hypothetical protein
MATPRTDQDSPWKLVLRDYFPEAIAFFFPTVAKVVDWTQPIEGSDGAFEDPRNKWGLGSTESVEVYGSEATV